MSNAPTTCSRAHRRQGKSLPQRQTRALAKRRHSARDENRQKVLRQLDRPRSLTAVKTRLYFAAAGDKRHGEELWRSDGTRKGTRMVRDIRHSAQDIRRNNLSSQPRNLTAVGNTLFFTASDARHGEELWRAGPKPSGR